MSAAPATQADEASASASAVSPAHLAFAQAREQIALRALERLGLIDDLLAALIAGEHVAMIGAPGVAKSLLARLLAGSIANASYFERLLTRFTEPHELFGPLDLQAFREGTSKHVATGMLPEAQIVFLDEAFKASSAILNTLLAALNERLWHDGSTIHSIPLQSAILASNELPPADCMALWDRCLVRHVVRPLQHETSRLALVMRKLPTGPLASPITLDHVDTLRARAEELTSAMPEAVARSLVKLVSELQGKHGVAVSDRRLFQMAGLLGAHAALEDSEAVSEDHFGRLVPTLWQRPEQIPDVEKLVERYAEAWRTQLKKHSEALGALRTQWETLKPRRDGTAAGDGIVLQSGTQVLRDARKTLATAKKHLEKAQKVGAVVALFEELETLITEVRTELDAITNA